MSEPVRVFVSYASQDRAFAERLVNDLKAAGAEVWWDVSGIAEGDFLDKINEALRNCQWLILVLTQHAIDSKWVNLEVNAAINRRTKGLMRGVLPFLAGGIKRGRIPPLWDTLHRYGGGSDYDAEIERLIRTLGLDSVSTVVGATGSEEAAAIPEQSPRVILFRPPIRPVSEAQPEVELSHLGYSREVCPRCGKTDLVPVAATQRNCRWCGYFAKRVTPGWE
jgi:hypothetical protein